MSLRALGGQWYINGLEASSSYLGVPMFLERRFRL